MGNRIFNPPADRTIRFIGDTHIGLNPSHRYTKVLQEVQRCPVGVACTVHIGDLTENGAAGEVPVAQAWWANFPTPKTLINGDHDLLQSTLPQWETQYGVTEFGTYDLPFVRFIRTTYTWSQARVDAIQAAAQAVPSTPCIVLSHRPLRDTVLAGTAPHDGFTTGTPYTFAVGATEDSIMRTMLGATPNIVAIISGHTHSWMDAPGFAALTTVGSRQVAAINCSSITYVGGTTEYQADPLRCIFLTLKPDNKTIEVRYRDYGASGVWLAPGGSRVTTLVTT